MSTLYSLLHGTSETFTGTAWRFFVAIIFIIVVQHAVILSQENLPNATFLAAQECGVRRTTQ